ncbi:MAG: fibronectin type III domain-containing protein [Clostridium sp.]|nr:fibronectin type III domain-containing protein [Clostridium sp.]MCM1398464.1 fibronectin type III domain-containing protein [Clostridium sp.]MCM1460186.1 fibronectin type III domain-containing protein [Bacteroides sp.]
MKSKTKKRVMLTLALAVIMTFAMSITALAATKVTGLKQTAATDSSVSFSWTGDITCQGYQVFKSNTLNGTYVRKSSYTGNSADVSAPNTIITGLSPATTYYVKVRAVYYSNGVYSYGPMSDALAVTTAPEKPKTVKELKATTSGVTLKWSKVSGATGYVVYRDNKKVASTKNTNVTIKQTVGTSQYYKVYAVRKVGSYTATSSNYASTYADAVPAKPVYVANEAQGNVKWNPDTNQVTLYADKNTKDKTCDGFQFVIYSANGKKKLKTITTDSAYTYARFTLKAVKNKGFSVKVRGYANINGKKCWGAWSARKVVVPQCKLSADLIDNTNTAKIKWAKVSGATKYYVYVAKNLSSSYNLSSSKFKKVATVSSKTTSYNVTGLQSSTYLCAYVIPAVKVGSKTYKGVKSTYYSWRYYSYYY